MVNIMRYDPFRETIRLSDAMNQLLEQSVIRPNRAFSNAFTVPMPIDLLETEQGYEVKAQLPGVKPEDIELTVKDNVLTLKAGYNEEKKDEKGHWRVREIRQGSFARTIQFPKAINSELVTTSYENGVLTVSAPYSEESRPKKISVTAKKAFEQGEAESAGAR